MSVGDDSVLPPFVVGGGVTCIRDQGSFVLMWTPNDTLGVPLV